MYRRLCNAYVSKVQTYLLKNPSAEIRLFTVNDFTNGFHPPSPASIRKVFESAKESAATPYGYSFKDRYTRELQSVDVEPDERSLLIGLFRSSTTTYLLAPRQIMGKMNEIISLAIVPVDKDSIRVARTYPKSPETRVLFAVYCLYGYEMVFYKAIFGNTLEMKLRLFSNDAANNRYIGPEM
ncbi:hypothetical protein IV203_004335 [Nitzschia inconspicua]|uniref:Uncharacterized protein n=1 Tax=Nitzschia inconspicua TaxID=303405 RepID=A0A9K3L3J4_9STRA|nr:hypothetical protein IV203_004335 [Nitzschia inconspicua]